MLDVMAGCRAEAADTSGNEVPDTEKNIDRVKECEVENLAIL